MRIRLTLSAESLNRILARMNWSRRDLATWLHVDAARVGAWCCGDAEVPEHVAVAIVGKAEEISDDPDDGIEADFAA